MGHHFWHPVQSLTPEPGGWRLTTLDGRTAGVVIAQNGVFEAWIRTGTEGRRVAAVHDLPTAAERLWRAVHPDAYH